jgi:hypothetical protein
MFNLGRFERVLPRWFGRGSAAALALLCAHAPAWALDAPRPEAGAYSIDAFAVREGDARLPQELLAPHGVTGSLPEAGAQGPVELAWTAHERAGFRGYRVTATIEDGPLSGVATQWSVAPGSGLRDHASGAYAYRIRFNLPVFSVAHVRASLEGVRADGSRVLLAVRDVRARPRSQTRDTAWTRPHSSDGGSLSPAVPQRTWLAIFRESTDAVELSASPSDGPTAARPQSGGAEATRVRGPPPAVA